MNLTELQPLILTPATPTDSLQPVETCHCSSSCGAGAGGACSCGSDCGGGA